SGQMEDLSGQMEDLSGQMEDLRGQTEDLSGQIEDLSGRCVGDYILREPVGCGTYGVVYRADHKILRRTACIKLIFSKRRRSPAERERFLREAQLLSKVQHRN